MKESRVKEIVDKVSREKSYRKTEQIVSYVVAGFLIVTGFIVLTNAREVGFLMVGAGVGFIPEAIEAHRLWRKLLLLTEYIKSTLERES